MKRKWAKKVKAVPACKAKRQVRTSAAAIGLIISTGASNLILARPSDSAPAAEPLVKEATVSKVTTNTEGGQPGSSMSLGQLSVEKSVTVTSAFSTLVMPTELVQLQAATLVTPAIPQVEPKEQKQTLNQLAATAQVEAAPELINPVVEETLSSSVANSERNTTRQSEQQAEKVIKTLRANRLIRQLKHSQIARRSQSNVFDRSQMASAGSIASPQPMLTEQLVPVISEAKSKWTGKQRLLINHLKQSNRLQESLAQLRFEESKSSAPVNQLAQPISSNVKAETTNRFTPFEIKSSEPQQSASLALLPQSREKDNEQSGKDWTSHQQSNFSPNSSQSLEQLEINHQIKIPDLADSKVATLTTNGKPPALLGLQVATYSDSKLTQLPQQSQAKVAVAMPNIVVEPTVVVPVEALDYQVKAGDTLTAIAHKHRLPLSKIIKVNHLDNPNRLQVKQRITIPLLQASISTSQNTGLLKRTEQSQPTAASVVSNFGTDSQPARTFVPSKLLATTPSLNSPYSGTGGNISEDDSVQPNSLNVNNTQRLQSTAAQKALLSNLYVRNLRTDIQKLRQKYRTQGIFTSQALPSVNQTSTMPLTTANHSEKPHKLRPNTLANQPINPEFSANQAAKTLQPDSQKRLPVRVKSTESTVRVRSRVATVPLGTNSAASLQSYQEQNVFPALPPLGGVDTYLPKPAAISARAYIWPAKGRLTSGYGWRWGRMHKGIDIAAPVGSPIFAAAAGVVVKAGWNSGGYGNMVDIQHADGSLTRYAHNKRILVQAGQVVEQGQQISEMGSTGFSTGPHLHFEMRPLGKKAVNPIAYLPR